MIRSAGVRVLRGLQIRDYDRRTAAAIFCVIGAHLGGASPLNGEGNILGHVRDEGRSSADPNARIYPDRRAADLPHRQRRRGRSALPAGRPGGGDSLLASAETIYNRMCAERPDLLACLFDPIAADRRGEVPEGAKPFMEIPPFSRH